MYINDQVNGAVPTVPARLAVTGDKTERCGGRLAVYQRVKLTLAMSGAVAHVDGDGERRSNPSAGVIRTEPEGDISD